jgi:Mor family transcriptional regulator
MSKRKISYHEVIRESFKQGYSADPKRGLLFGKKGEPLTVKNRGKQKYPTVCVAVYLPQRIFMSVPAHKLMAYYIYGERALSLVVRHLNANTEDIREKNLRVGTHSQNNLDKPPHIRIRAAKIARASQGYSPLNKKINTDLKNKIQTQHKLGLSYKKIASKFGISKSTVFNVIKGSYAY